MALVHRLKRPRDQHNDRLHAKRTRLHHLSFHLDYLPKACLTRQEHKGQENCADNSGNKEDLSCSSRCKVGCDFRHPNHSFFASHDVIHYESCGQDCSKSNTHLTPHLLSPKELFLHYRDDCHPNNRSCESSVHEKSDKPSLCLLTDPR